MKKYFALFSSLAISPLFLFACTNTNTVNNSANTTGYVSSYKGHESPKYTVLKQDDNLEIRQYQSALIAEVEVNGENRDDAVEKGFKILADYIFGGNTSGKNIAMTSPVTQIQNNNGALKTWLVQFTMPAQYTLETLPKAKNEQIRFYNSEGKKAAAIKYSGLVDDEKIALNQIILVNYIAQNSLKVISAPVIAYYDDPFTFPWNRRNEIIFYVAP